MNPGSGMSLRESASAAALFLVGVVLAPVSITLLYRLSDRMPTVFPLILITALAVAVFRRNLSRPLAIGLVVGEALYVVLMVYLLSTWGDIDEIGLSSAFSIFGSPPLPS